MSRERRAANPADVPAADVAAGHGAAVPIDVATVLLEFRASGRLLPWLGPAVRGVVAARFRERHCRLSLADQAGPWRRCQGCRHLPHCAYGRTLEPDGQVLPATASRTAARQEVPRAIVFSPSFPAPVRAEPGLRLPMSLIAIGGAAQESLGELMDVLAEAGRAGVFGTDRLRFDVVDRGAAPMRISLAARGLPAGDSGDGGRASRVRVILTSPLFLRDRDPVGRPVPCRSPSFQRLVRAAVDTVASIAFVHSVPVSDDTRALVAMARDVPTIEQNWQVFDQEKLSNRSRSRFDMRGVVGEAVFGPVPRAVLPWLALAGQIHVGGHRVAGAGGWRLEVRP